MRLTEQLPGLKLFYFKPPDMESLHFIKSFKTLNFVRRVKYLKKRGVILEKRIRGSKIMENTEN